MTAHFAAVTSTHLNEEMGFPIRWVGDSFVRVIELTVAAPQLVPSTRNHEQKE